MINFKEKIEIFIFLILVLLVNSTCNYRKKNISNYNISIERVEIKNESSQTEFFPKALFRLKIFNKGSDTLLFIKGTKDHFYYSNNFFKIDSTTDNDLKLKSRMKYFLPYKDDPNFYILSPESLTYNKIIIPPNMIKYLTVYRAYNGSFSSYADSVEFHNYLRSLKIKYNNNLNHDSLRKKFPNYHIIESVIITPHNDF